MNKRTYVCKSCGQTGHNSRTCAAASKSEIVKTKKTSKKEKVSLADQEQSSNGSWRKCGYCFGKGHTSSTCVAYAKDKRDLTEKVNHYFNLVTDHLNKKTHLAPGSIIKIYNNFNTRAWVLQPAIAFFLQKEKENPEKFQNFRKLYDAALTEGKETGLYNLENESGNFLSVPTYGIGYYTRWIILENPANNLLFHNAASFIAFTFDSEKLFYAGSELTVKEGTDIKTPAFYNLVMWLTSYAHTNSKNQDVDNLSLTLYENSKNIFHFGDLLTSTVIVENNEDFVPIPTNYSFSNIEKSLRQITDNSPKNKSAYDRRNLQYRINRLIRNVEEQINNLGK